MTLADRLPELIAAHLRLVLAALAVAVALSVPLGVLATRRPLVRTVALGLAGVVQTVPGLALLAAMVPLLTAVGRVVPGVPAIGYLPALLALVLYSILPILRNTVVGIEGVDAAVVEAARAVGMTPGQRLRLVELPLALPVIVAGVRTATVWLVGLATLSTPIGCSSLGDLIFLGLQTRNDGLVAGGCVAAAGLALTLDGLVRAVELGLGGRRGLLGLGGVGLVLVCGVAVASAWPSPGAERPPVRIGAKGFTEQYVLAELMAEAVRSTGRRAVTVTGLGSTVAFDALVAGQLDAYVDYSGTLWTAVLQREASPGGEAMLAELQRALPEEHGVHLVARPGFENAYALAMREDHAAALGVERISQLAPVAAELTMGADLEFYARREWRDLVDRYGLAFRERRTMDASLMYEALAGGQVDVVTAYTTDGRLVALGLRVLDDDRDAIPPYDAVVLASARLVLEEPEVVRALQRLEGRLPAATMRALNAQVDAEGREPAAVAAAAWASLVP